MWPPVPGEMREAKMSGRQAVSFFCASVALVALASSPHAQQPQRFIYAAAPGVGGGNNMSYGGAGILVFDVDHGHKFVKRIPLQGSPDLQMKVPPGSNRNPQEAIK